MSRLSSFRVGSGTRGTVLLHGFLGSGRNLRTLATEWSAREPDRVFLLPDLTGHGSSPPLPEDATLETVASDVLETARDAQLAGPLELVGHSLGGRLALVASSLPGAQVSRLTLLDITPGPIPPEVSESGQVLEVLLRAPPRADSRGQLRQVLLADGLTPALADWLLMSVEPEPSGGGIHWKIDRASLDRFQRRVNPQDLWPLFEGASMPRLCVRGGRSPYVREADVARMRAAGARVETLDAGHYVHVDALPDLLQLLTEA